jgi:hypothetical protein
LSLAEDSGWHSGQLHVLEASADTPGKLHAIASQPPNEAFCLSAAAFIFFWNATMIGFAFLCNKLLFSAIPCQLFYS